MIDYSCLEKSLADREWQNADEETCRKLVEISGVNEFRDLYPDELRAFPLNELIALDRLWQNYSNNWFGYSSQKEVWEDLGNPNIYWPFPSYNQEEIYQFDRCFLKQLRWFNGLNYSINYHFNNPKSVAKGYLPSYPGHRGNPPCYMHITRGLSWRWQCLVLERDLSGK
ncbi:GUN4 domain-containing protein [Pseudanabaena sp. PCC 6802]|uniref:GUN4 domain-containing protein n=1 Tax=Pseudanabaena sp. PCC 6802 TaxID=118173 RepID=UPI00138B1487|nr:GUN4 domain-containing protein [Pseudanabaena sp. PCC 6802]